MSKILLAYYGDDFTGSTDALEFITRAGAKAVLFTETPTAEQLKSFPDLDAYGVAGKTRALPPDEMEKILLPAFEQMKANGADHVHYKVCSTFDSSPTVGSIGKAIDCGAEVFNNKTIPVLGGTPALGRFCAFGNLFAKMGIGSEGKIYRLDRHPSMSTHPSTPMNESDLRLHIGKQTNRTIGLIDFTQLKKEVTGWNCDDAIVLVDALSINHLERIGEWLNYLQNDQPLFTVGSSAVEMALGMHWNNGGLLTPKTEFDTIEKVVPLLVISGSCSPVTTAQIEYAKANGFEEVILDATAICNNENVEANAVTDLLLEQKNVVVHTGTRQAANLSAEKLGTVLGAIARNAVEQTNIKRVVVSGGDTSSYAARAMQIDAVEMVAPIVIGAPLCKAYSANKAMDGLEVNFKGGQVGSENYFKLMSLGSDQL